MTLSIDRAVNPTHLGKKLEQVIEDIALKVQIESDFTLTHPEHQSIQIPAELQSPFAQLPSEVQQNYLQVKLQQFLQSIYYISQPQVEPERQEKIENKAIKWSKSEFVQQLRHNNHSENHLEPGWQILAETEEGFLQVSKNGLTLHISRDRHLSDQEKLAQVGDIVRVKMPPQLVEPGYFIAVGTAGSINDLILSSDNPIVDVYLNISSQGALALMKNFTAELNAIAVPFHFQVLYRTDDYIYNDTAILSFVKQDYERIQPIIATIYQEHQAYFQPEIPLFTKYLASGLSIAERPALDIHLAQHRFQIIAEGLLAAWQQGKTSISARFQYISDRFQQKNISLEQPYLNPHSTNIYTAI
jgi:hypothetical protein